MGLRLGGGVLSLAGGALGEVGLVALALGVSEVVALVVVEGEAELALIASQVVAHEVGVLGQVDRLQRQPPQPLPPVDRLILRRGGPAAPGLRSPVPIHLPLPLSPRLLRRRLLLARSLARGIAGSLCSCV